MKKIIYLPLLMLLLLSACFSPENDEIISDGVQRLVIENAFYHNTLTGCNIRFDYYVTEDTALYGGYAIDWQDGSGNAWQPYSMTPLYPGTRYTINKHYKHWASLPPVVGMSVYPLHDNDTFEALVTQDTLIKK